MSFEMTIRANDPQEFAQQCISLAFMMAPNLKDRLAGGTAPVEPAPEPEKKPARKAAAKKEAKEDVHGSGQVAAAAGGDAGTDDGGPAADAPADEAKAEAPAEPAAEETASAAPSMSIDELRKYTINEYLNVVFDSQPDRSAAFKKLCEHFDTPAIGKLPADKIDAWKAKVDEEIAAAVKK